MLRHSYTPLWMYNKLRIFNYNSNAAIRLTTHYAERRTDSLVYIIYRRQPSFGRHQTIQRRTCAKHPTQIIPQIPAAPCTLTALTGSSIRRRSKSRTDMTVMKAPTPPIINASHGRTTAQPATNKPCHSGTMLCTSDIKFNKMKLNK